MKKKIEKKITIGHKTDGTPMRKSFYGKTLREVEAKIKEYHQTSQYPEVDNRITLAEWGEKWLDTYKRSACSEATIISTYMPEINRINKYFKDARLCAVRNVDVQKFFQAHIHLSQSRLRKLYITLNAIFATAIENDLIIKNPCKGIKYKSTQTPEEKRAYTQAETDDIIEYAKTHKYGAAVIVMLRTGLRRGELLALRWQDINLKARVLSVRQAVSLENGRAIVGEPKTAASKADLPIPDDLIPVLQSIPRMIGVEYVFHSPKGKVYNPRNWDERRFGKFMEDYQAHNPEARLLNPHELRHTFGTLTYAATGDIYITSKLMRHSSVDITAKTYVHENMDMMRAAAAKSTTIVRH